VPDGWAWPSGHTQAFNAQQSRRGNHRADAVDAIRTTFRNPPFLASEDRAQYENLKRLVLSDIKPRGLHEILLARDIVEAEWEVRRQRTFFNYLMRPVSDSLSRAFREY
jgi:hypothetical protein